MNTEEFVAVIQKHVVDTIGPDLVTILRKPPGRKPDAQIVALSRWYNGLSDDDKAMVEQLLAIAARDAVFGVFTVLDGSTQVDPTWEEDDHFELRHHHGGHIDVISGPDTPLHEFLP
jgi:hypothetical protein